MKPRLDDAQIPLPLWTPTVAIPQGDGSFVVKPGRPVEWMTPSQFSAAVGLHRNTIYGYIGSDLLPERFVTYVGLRKIRIQAAAVEHFQARSRNQRLGLPTV